MSGIGGEESLIMAELRRLSDGQASMAASLHEKMDGLTSDMHQMNVTLAVQATQLTDHIRRTELLEEAMEVVRADIKPLQESAISTKTIMKILPFIFTVIAGLAAFAADIKELILHK